MALHMLNQQSLWTVMMVSLYKAIGGTAGQLLEQNAQALDQISANFASFKVHKNINLFCQARNNILSIMNEWELTCEIAEMGKKMLLTALKNDKVDTLYIDNTYCKPSYSFPTREVAAQQVGESESFVSELLTTLPTTIADLEPHQIHTFYESVGYMIQAELEATKREEYLQRLMNLPNQKWSEIIGHARGNADFLKDQDVIRTVLNILQTNTSVASASIEGTSASVLADCLGLDPSKIQRKSIEVANNDHACSAICLKDDEDR